MKSSVEIGAYVIAGVRIEVNEGEGMFCHPGKRYGIYGARVENMPGAKNGARFVIEGRESTKPMRIRTDVPGAMRAVRVATRGNGWYLGIMPPGQMVMTEIGKDDNTSIGLVPGGIDCWIAGEGGLELVDFSKPGYEAWKEVEVSPKDRDVPREFWRIKSLLEEGRVAEAGEIYRCYNRPWQKRSSAI
ncbi:hypothetical protein A3K55_02150 [Candidatus Shapirobacteria bacterium RBG_13_44_7]|uniref:Uncharacterized protein n=1 Tax=Candidatus Shapirobacteria bacterium RBG_13_44_7 TaxID=1802149 RepID=A0A1F7SI86_9BACT|nr:MAG: hypothetical protein A3K55_02150 [Candidatus Shapirobacteria bacterium RBG_13_44_7]